MISRLPATGISLPEDCDPATDGKEKPRDHRSNDPTIQLFWASYLGCLGGPYLSTALDFSVYSESLLTISLLVNLKSQNDGRRAGESGRTGTGIWTRMGT
jgi:hypothetical protein